MDEFLEKVTLVLSLNEWVGVNQVEIVCRCGEVVPRVSVKSIWEAIIVGFTHLNSLEYDKKNQEVNKVSK